jgi:hypothetical protein
MRRVLPRQGLRGEGADPKGRNFAGIGQGCLLQDHLG